MKKYFLLFIILFAFYNANSQTPSFDWVKQLGCDSGTYNITATASDASGNIFSCGVLVGTIDIDPDAGIDSITDSGFGDILIVKQDSSGHLLWYRQIGQSSYDQANSLTCDNQGNVYVTGFFSLDSTDFDGGPNQYYLHTQGGATSFVMKLNPQGNLLWAEQPESVYSNSAKSLVLDAAGNVLVTGTFEGTVDFDPSTSIDTLTSSVSDDIYIWKLNASGGYIWSKRIETGVTNSRSYSVTSDGINDVYIDGLLLGTIDLDPGTGVFNLTNSNIFGSQFIVKLDASGNFVWAKAISSVDPSSSARSLVSDITGNVYTCGYFNGTVDFDPNAAVYNLSNTISVGASTYLLKLTALGDLGYAIQIGEAGNGDPKSLAMDQHFNVYICGSLHGNGDFDPDTSVYNLAGSNGDVYVASYNYFGYLLWAVNFSNNQTAASVGKSLCVDKFGNVITSGSFAGTADFDPGIGTAFLTGNLDVFMQKMVPPTATGIQHVVQADEILVYPNPSFGKVHLLHLPEGVLNFQLLTVQGQLLVDELKSQTDPEVNLSDIANGLYFYRIMKDDVIIDSGKLMLSK